MIKSKDLEFNNLKMDYITKEIIKLINIVD